VTFGELKLVFDIEMIGELTSIHRTSGCFLELRGIDWWKEEPEIFEGHSELGTWWNGGEEVIVVLGKRFGCLLGDANCDREHFLKKNGLFFGEDEVLSQS